MAPWVDDKMADADGVNFRWEKGAPGFQFQGQLIKGFWQFWTDFFDIGTVGIVRDSQNDSGGQTIKFCSFRGSNGVKWGSTGGND